MRSTTRLYLQYSVNFVIYKWAFLAFQQYAWFQTFHSVPHVLGDVNAISAVFLTDDA